MNYKNFSLDYIQPEGAPADGPSSRGSDPWLLAIDYYAKPILQTLQGEGSKKLDELFSIIRERLNVPDLQLDQFVEVVHRLSATGKVMILKSGASPADEVIGLPITR